MVKVQSWQTSSTCRPLIIVQKAFVSPHDVIDRLRVSLLFVVKKGDRVAQLIIERISTPPVMEVEELDDTERGAGGFGSTGRN